jgi:hypothetical protein
MLQISHAEVCLDALLLLLLLLLPPLLLLLVALLLPYLLLLCRLSYHSSATKASCVGFPPDPDYGIMFCPDNGNVGVWPQGSRCSADCQHGIVDSDQKPYVICQSTGSWSDIVGLCKAPCQLPPALCP